MPIPLPDALAEIETVLLDPDRLVRAVAAGRRRGRDHPAWRRVELRPVDLAAGRRLQVVRYDQTQAFTANLAYGEQAAGTVAELLASPFGNWHVDTVDSTIQLRVTKGGDAQVHRAAPRAAAALREHDRIKPRILDPADPVFHLLGLTTADGEVKPTRQDKLRQVEEFLRALDPMLASLPDGQRAEPTGADPRRGPIRLIDLGCGNAYLTFAAYRFLTAVRGLSVELTGVDVKAAARKRNTALARELGAAAEITFIEGTIADVPVEAADIVLALHACDTATDEALARAVRWQAPVVLAAPCCHHDIAAQLRRQPAPAPYELVARHGILRERFADVLTDALRAAILRLLGYRVEVIEFIESRHTPRNVLIRAVRTGAAPAAEQARDYRALVQAWGVRPRLAELLTDLLEPVIR
jgi:SAM-dependent methyltransferase